ncbi:MAG: SRPBCC family protein [Gemmatimonadota bacterium]|nr:SRPBCC family protein [Gemmatimonadota bacterium]
MSNQIRDEVSITIERRVRDVFAYMDDVGREHEWQPHLIEADQTPPGPTRLGTRKRYVSQFLKKRLENTYEVVMIEPGERVVYQTTADSDLQAAVEITWEPAGKGTRVTMRIDGSIAGPLRMIPQKILERARQSELEASLGRLKQVLESEGDVVTDTGTAVEPPPGR